MLTYWALRKAGHAARAGPPAGWSRFLVLMYGVYLIALILFGILLRTGVLPGDDPLGGTIVPAGVAAGVIAVFLLSR